MWNPEPRYLPYKEYLATLSDIAWLGGPGHPCSREVLSDDMFAKTCRGDSTKDVIASAAAQLKQIYKAKSSTRPSRLRRRR